MDATPSTSPMRLSEDQMARLYKLTLQVSRTLRRDVSPTAVLRMIIGYGLTVAEEQRDFARRLRDDGASPPWLFHNRMVPRARAQKPSRESGGASSPKRGRHRELGRRGQ